MAKMTLLEMVQNILSAMSSDEVNSISDTVESQQVAEEIRTTFFELFSNRSIPEFEGLIALEAVSGKPNQLKIPDNVTNIKWVKYRNARVNDDSNFQTVNYVSPEDFIERFVTNRESQFSSYTDVTLLDSSPVEYRIATNSVPTHYTIFESDNVMVFNSFDEDLESNLTASNSIAWGTLQQTFTLSDDFIPPIDANMFPHLLHEARSACFINIKELPNSKEEQRAKRQLIRSLPNLNRDKNQRGSVFDGHDYSRNR